MGHLPMDMFPKTAHSLGTHPPNCHLAEIHAPDSRTNSILKRPSHQGKSVNSLTKLLVHFTLLIKFIIKRSHIACDNIFVGVLKPI